MFAAAASFLFYGFIAAVLIDPYVGLAFIAVGFCALFWRVFAVLALPFLALAALCGKVYLSYLEERRQTIR